MNVYLNEIRMPVKIPVSKGIRNTILILLLGILLGAVSKFLDETASNSLPILLEKIDLGNVFSRTGIWIFIALLISIYSKSPVRAALDVFLFFCGMVASYYLYTIFIAGFYPKSYMMLWIGITFVTPFLAFICWYAKGNRPVSVLISSIIFLIITRQAFAFGFWYFDVRYAVEFMIWVAMLFVLYATPRRWLQTVLFGTLLYLLTSQLYWWFI